VITIRRADVLCMSGKNVWAGLPAQASADDDANPARQIDTDQLGRPGEY